MVVDYGPVITRGASVKNEIDKEMCSLSYTSVDTVVEKKQQLYLGKNELLAKLDINNCTG